MRETAGGADGRQCARGEAVPGACDGGAGATALSSPAVSEEELRRRSRAWIIEPRGDVRGTSHAAERCSTARGISEDSGIISESSTERKSGNENEGPLLAYTQIALVPPHPRMFFSIAHHRSSGSPAGFA